jgi:flagellar biosynthesis/type III secretory pathway M-ring protein FliF/YscJ
MKDYFNKIKEQLLKIWNNFTKTQKIIFSVSIIVCLLIIGIIAAMSSSETYVPLFNHKLELQEAGQIKKALDEWHYTYNFNSTK